MAYHLQRFRPKHQPIIEMLLDGLNHTQIAENMRMPVSSISRIVNSPVFKAELKRRRDKLEQQFVTAEIAQRLNAREVLDRAATPAAQKQADLLRSENERVAQISAMDILDRTGHPKLSRTEGRHTVNQIVIDEKLLARMQRATREAYGEELELRVENSGSDQPG